MDNNAFVELANREIAKLSWWTDAREIIVNLRNAESAQAKAEAACAQAVAERDKVLADIATRKERDAKAAEKSKADLQAALRREQEQAEKALKAAEANLELVGAQTRVAERELTEAAATLERYRAAKIAEERETQARIDALVAVERDIKERLDAAHAPLKR